MALPSRIGRRAVLLLALAIGVSLPLAAQARVLDTTLTVSRPGVVSLTSHAGEVLVRTWDRSAVRVVAEYEPGTRVQVRRHGPRVSIATESEDDDPAIEFRVTLPPWMPLRLDGVNVSVNARGVTGGMAVSTINGEIRVVDGQGALSLESVQGEIVVRRSGGRIQAHAINGVIELDQVRGAIVAETVNGEILLRRVVSDSIAASTVNGALCFDGALRAGGVYRFTTHNGDIAIGIADGSDARVSVATYSGDFVSDFPVRKPRESNRFAFQIGSGGALLDLESFQGKIRLRRPGILWKEGEPPCAEDEDEHEHESPKPRSPKRK
jgi:hypothetical protein